MNHNDIVMGSLDRSKPFFKDSALLWIAAFIFFCAGIVNQRSFMPRLELNKQQTAVNVNKNLLIFLSAGNKRLITDLLWVQTLLESDIEHYASHDLNSWMYLRFSTIAKLDPYFYQNYVWGGQYLSIIKDDLAGATKLMEEGLKYFPDDFKLNYNLGFAYYYELGDYRKGVKFMEKIQNHPKAPIYIPSLVMKMKAEMGFDYNAIIALIYDFMKTTKDESLKERLTKDIYAVKAERDIVCLNDKKANCETRDAFGEPYVLMNGKYHSKTPFIPYRLKKKGDNKQTRQTTTVEER